MNQTRPMHILSISVIENPTKETLLLKNVENESLIHFNM